MRRWVIGIGVLGVLALVGAVQSHTVTFARGAAEHGWISLFNGKTLEGWQVHKGGGWKVENGALVCSGATAGWVQTVVPSSNYTLKLQFRGKSTVNSGVFVRAQKEGLPWVSGYECQIWPSNPTGYNTGSLVGAVKALPAEILSNRWNRYEITANGDHFVVVLNGKTLLNAHNSKHLTGKVIGLQCDENNPIRFRKIMLKPLAE